MSAGTPEDEGFLGRWSRRKRAVAEPATMPVSALPPAELSADGAVPAVDPRQADSQQTERPQTGLPQAEPELIEPPSLDLIDKDFQLAPWLKLNVPEAWKLAAMRRAWENDPAIAGFENPARDYALDWNTPGGAPGYGPLTESDDVAEMVRGIFGEPPPEKPDLVAQEATGDAMSHQLSSDAEDGEADGAAQEQQPSENQPLAIRRSDVADPSDETPSAAGIATQPIYAAVQQTDDRADLSMRTRRRGGGAIPN